MNTRAELFLYTLLIATAALMSYFLVRNALTARAERADLSEFDIGVIENEIVELPEPIPLETAVYVFEERSLFENLNELLPTPTEKIYPTPTPTTVPLCEGWSIVNIMGSRLAQIQEPSGTKHILKAGDTIPKGDPNASYVLRKIEKDRVFIIRDDGIMGWVHKGGGVEYAESPPE
jgi:hypothetical protein